MELLIVGRTMVEAQDLLEKIAMKNNEFSNARAICSVCHAKCMIKQCKPDVVLCSVEQNEEDGNVLALWLKKWFSDIKVILFFQ